MSLRIRKRRVAANVYHLTFRTTATHARPATFEVEIIGPDGLLLRVLDDPRHIVLEVEDEYLLSIPSIVPPFECLYLLNDLYEGIVTDADFPAKVEEDEDLIDHIDQLDMRGLITVRVNETEDTYDIIGVSLTKAGRYLAEKIQRDLLP